MTDHIAKSFAGYMAACYGPAWAVRLPSEQINEARQGYYSGALAYQHIVTSILDPGDNQLTAAEIERGDQIMCEINEELRAYGNARAFDLFTQSTNGGGNA